MWSALMSAPPLIHQINKAAFSTFSIADGFFLSLLFNKRKKISIIRKVENEIHKNTWIYP